MKKAITVVLIGVFIILGGLLFLRQRFIRGQYEEISELLPADSLSYYLEFPHFNDSMEEIFTENAFFNNFNRENLEKVLPEETWKDIETVLNDPYFTDASKRERMFNEQIVLAGYSTQGNDFNGLLGIRGQFKPEEYYSLIMGMQFLKDEGFLIRDYQGQSYYEGQITLDSDINILENGEEQNIYIFNLKNCFFIASSEELVHLVLDFYLNPDRSISGMDMFADNKPFRKEENIVAWGFGTDEMGSKREFRYYSEGNTLRSVSTSELSVPSDVRHFETLLPYYRKEGLFNALNSSSNYEMIEQHINQYFTILNAFVEEEVDYELWLDFIEQNWDGGHLLELGVDFDTELQLDFYSLFPVKHDNGHDVLEELSHLLEQFEIQKEHDKQEIILGAGGLAPHLKIFFKEDDRLLGMSSGDLPDSTEQEEELRSELELIRERYGLSGVPSGMNYINGEKMSRLYEQVKAVFLPLSFFDPSIAPRLEFGEELVNSVDHVTGYTYYKEDDKPGLESITYFQAR